MTVRFSSLLLVLAGACASGRDLVVPVPAPATERQPDDTRPSAGAAIDALFDDLTGATPGCVVAVAKDGAILHARGYGLASLELGVPLTPESVLDIGSTAKQVTASCVVLLALEGTLSLEDPVGKHVPELAGELATPTLRQLLTHTSGIPDYIGLLLAGGKHLEDWTTADDALAALVKVRSLAFPAGSQFEYSNSNYFLLSQVVETASSMTLREFARARFFGPLGMASTDYVDDHKRVVANRASSYSSPVKGSFRLETSCWEQNGDGGLLTTALDLVRWAENLETGHVGGQAYVEAMRTRGRLSNGKELDYGFGLDFRRLDRRPAVAHAGAWAGFRAELLRVPSEHLTVVCLSNWTAVDPTSRAKRVARLFLEPLP